MAFVFGNDYGSLFGNVLATQQSDAANYWRFADAHRQAQQDQFNQGLAQAKLQAEAQDRQRQMMQFDFTRNLDLQRLALARTGEERQARGESRRETLGERSADLAEKEFDYKKNLPSPTQERDSAMLFRGLKEVADRGELSDDDLEGVPEDHASVLFTINDRAKKLISGQKSKLDDAAQTLNRIIALEHYTNQTKDSGHPGPIGWMFSPRTFGLARNRYNSGEMKDWQDELDRLKKNEPNPEIKSHLRMDKDGWWQPNFELPWAAVAGAGPAAGDGPAMTAGTATGGEELTPEIAQRFIQQAGGNNNAARQMARAAGYTF